MTNVYGYEDVEPPFHDMAPSKYNLEDVKLNREDDEIYVGRMFADKSEFKLATRIYALKRAFRFRFSCHALHYTVASCYSKKCDWRVYAHEIGDSEEYEVRKAHLDHVCDAETRKHFNKHATSKEITAIIKQKYCCHH